MSGAPAILRGAKALMRGGDGWTRQELVLRDGPSASYCAIGSVLAADGSLGECAAAVSKDARIALGALADRIRGGGRECRRPDCAAAGGHVRACVDGAVAEWNDSQASWGPIAAGFDAAIAALERTPRDAAPPAAR